MSRQAVIAAALVTAIAGGVAFSATIGWSRTRSVLKQDGLGYFLYTRSLVRDLDTDLTDDLAGVHQRFNDAATESIDRYRRRNPVTGRKTLPWPIGVAIFQAPFYAVGWGVEHVAAWSEGRAADSLGTIPQVAFAAGTLVWALVGFWLMVHCCRAVADARPALVAAGAAALTGPLVFYTFFHPTMAHGVSFALTALLTLLWLRRWRAEPEAAPRPRTWLAIGLVFGAMVAVRYQNAVFGVLPAALLVREIVRHGVRPVAPAAGLAALGAALAVGPQVLHLAVNHGLFQAPAAVASAASDTVAEVAQNRMDPTSPHFFQVLFSCQHGAFYWAPFLAVGLGGLVWAGVRGAGWARVLVATLLCHVYLVGTLQEINWSASAAFGMRYLTECAPFFALGFAALFAATAARVRLAWWGGATALFAAANGLLVVAYSLRTISQEDCVTWPEMFEGVGRALEQLAGRVG